MRVHYFIAILFVFSILLSCKSDRVEKTKSNKVSVQIERDPSYLFPSKSMGSVESQINTYLYLSLANFDPENLNLIPILIESIPDAIPIEDGPFKNTVRFDCSIRPEVVWDDGTPVTGYDYLFSVKLYKYDQLKTNAAIRSIFKQLKDVEVDPDDPKKFSVYISKGYILDLELAMTADIIPEYAYDSLGVMRQFDLVDGQLIEQADQDSLFLNQKAGFISFINEAKCGREVVVGCGPYQLSDWSSNQFVQLEKKKDYWGNAYPENPYLQANPEKIQFSIYKDKNAAITSLQNETLDLIDEMNGAEFIRFKENERMKNKFDFHSPSQLSYYFIGMNQASPFLKDIRIRKALAHLVDVDAFIANQEMGIGTRLPAPIIPLKSYFNDTLDLIEFNPEKARTLIEEAGWADSNQDGIMDKIVDGEHKDLQIRIHITGKVLGKNLALTLKEKAKLAGIEIDIITKESRLIRQDLAERNFDLYPTGTIYGPYPEDLYQSWHSANDFPGGSNRYAFNNPEADHIIEEMRVVDNPDSLRHLMFLFQEITYRDQPLIFLYSPTNNIVINNRWDAKSYVMKPGYRLNQFKLKE